jgi:beta-glucanase (GH16 family)
MGYQNYAGAWLTQSDAAYDWLANPSTPVSLGGGIDTIKIWQSYTLPTGDPNLIVFGDGNYAAGNASDNVIKADASHVLIYGGAGDDVFVGSGGSGTTFIVAQGEGDKVIQNFTEGADTLRLIGGPVTSFSAVQAAMRQQGADVVLNDGGTNILFRGATVGQFHAGDFQLPLSTATLGAQTFAEDFNSASTIGTNWQTNFGYGGLASYTLTNNGELELYTSPSFTGTGSTPLGLNPFSVSGGVLTISATPVTAAQSAQMWGYHYSSGMLESNFSQTYGYFEMRAELPHGQGLWPAFWLLGESNKEIDVLEGLGSDTKTAYNAVHSPDVPSLGNASFNPYGDGFHTYGVLWTPSTLTYYVDGTPVWQTATPADMNSPMHMIVNLAVGGAWPGAPDATTPFPADLQIDYVHAYALGDPSAPAPASPPPPPPVPPPPASGGLVLSSSTNFPGSVLTGGAGNDTLNAGLGSDTMTGGAGADTFVWAHEPWSPGHITDFQPGVDRLDVSGLYTGGYHGSDPVADGYVRFVTDGHGGTAVLVDADGPGGGASFNYVADLEGVSPTGLTSAQVFGGAGVVLTSTTNFPGSVLTGRSANDTLNAGQGSDTLTGGAGADHFVFAHLPWAPAEITDFVHGQDVIDLRGVFAGSGYAGADPVADHKLTLISDGAGGTKVLYGSSYFLHVDHVAPGAFTGADWLTH